MIRMFFLKINQSYVIKDIKTFKAELKLISLLQQLELYLLQHSRKVNTTKLLQNQRLLRINN